MTRRCAAQVPTRKVRVTAADHVPALLAELELTPLSAENKRTSLGKAVVWQQSQALALLHLDTRAATEAVELCRKDAPGTSSVPCTAALLWMLPLQLTASECPAHRWQ